MYIPGKRVIGQYVYYDAIDEAIKLSLKDSEWKKDLFNLLNDPIMVTDSNGNIIVVNDSFARMRGVRKEYLIGQNVKSFDPPSMVCHVLETKKAFRGLSQREEGSFYIVDILPILQNDMLFGAIMIVKDINAIEKTETDRKETTNNFQDENSIEIIGDDPNILKLKEKVGKIAKSDLSVLITGETGSGKELIAKSIHCKSMRSTGPFIAVNCSSFSSSLIESELFGYDDGAFTGAKKGGKPGLFEVANGGTLFLDEIGDMPLEFQPKLLRVLEEYSIRRVGSNRNRFINIRLIAATNKPISELCQSKSFRTDLYYRLSGVNIIIPPLRERASDVHVLINYFLKNLNEKNKKSVIITPSALYHMQSYSWPGNVRELKNVISSLFYLSEDGIIKKSDLPDNIVTDNNSSKVIESSAYFKSEFEVREQLLFEFLKTNESVSNREYCNLTNVNRVTAYRDLSRFVSADKLEVVGKGRSVKYVKNK